MKAHNRTEERLQAELAALHAQLAIKEAEVARLQESAESLLQREGRYHMLFARMSEGFALHEILYDTVGQPCDYRFLDVNPAFERITGISRDRCIGRSILEIFPELDRSWIEIYGRVSMTGEPVRFQKHANILDKEFEVVAFCPQKGQFATLIADVTEQRRAEAGEALKESHERLLAVLDSLDAGVYVSDMDTHEILYANRYLQNIFGELRGRICWQVLQKGQSGPCNFCTNERLRLPVGLAGEVYIWELHNTMANRWYLVHDRAIKWVDGRIVRLEIATDITERKQMEEALKKAYDELDQRLKMIRRAAETEEKLEKQAQLAHAGRLTALGEMAAAMAHEINQPLTVIRLSVEYLKTCYLKNGRITTEAEALDDIIAQVKRAAGIISNMRSFSTVNTDALVPIDLVEPLDLALSFFREQFRIHQIHLTVLASEALPRLKVDPRRFEQIVVNFLSNARYAVDIKEKASQNSDYQKIVAVRLFYDIESEAVVLEVEDNGIGMSPEVRDRCLEPFYTTKPMGEGSGIGLSVVHGITREFNMHVEIESTDGKGSTFRVYMPA